MCLNTSPHTSSQASLDPLLVGSLYASVAGMPPVGSVRVPGGCRAASLGSLLDQNTSMLVKHHHHNWLNLFFLPLSTCMSAVCSRAWDACTAQQSGLCFGLQLQVPDAKNSVDSRLKLNCVCTKTEMCSFLSNLVSIFSCTVTLRQKGNKLIS